ncbi:ABC transporter substrate-binding protein [Corynebacterium aquatimens]|uniref:Iron complex transport system substrate-binding protein n=1 Tax=Corynebacterium aquatimens TaxID=1190508 RepID=A0A931DZL5_9CORY|nr:ABC transporter substrate-binding protein [Corynebacterium aquatimens]MBG6121598.1 iron complex transport system substrate-binding protein [Corynebacterium aquatimens]WJY65862.1 putative siderophore-binding lipoprotein YfiY precursor [Corynebacterium aquatimens]
MKFTRRGFIKAATVAVAISLGLSACSGENEAPTVQGSTREVTDAMDAVVTVPENPQRIIALSEPTTDGLLALGIKPIGITAGRGQGGVSAYLSDVGGDIPIVGNVGNPNFEAIGAAKPDLIVVDGTSVNNNPPVLEALSQIAPVVFTGYSGGNWRDNLIFLAEAVNKQKEAVDVIADYDARAADLKERFEKYNQETFSIVRWQGNSFATILKELPAGRALEDVGLRRPPAQDRKGRGHSEPVSAENIQDIDADYMFFGTLGGSSVGNPNAGGAADEDAATDAAKQAESVPGFTSLKAFKNGKIIPVDGSAWTSTGGPLLMNHILDDLEATLL